MKKFKVGQKVVVTKKYNIERKMYPFMPDLAGKEGEIFRIQTETNETHSSLDMPIYWVRFEKFKVGIIPEGECSHGYYPTEFIETTDFCFCDNLK